MALRRRAPKGHPVRARFGNQVQGPAARLDSIRDVTGKRQKSTERLEGSRVEKAMRVSFTTFRQSTPRTGLGSTQLANTQMALSQETIDQTSVSGAMTPGLQGPEEVGTRGSVLSSVVERPALVKMELRVFRRGLGRVRIQLLAEMLRRAGSE